MRCVFNEQIHILRRAAHLVRARDRSIGNNKYVISLFAVNEEEAKDEEELSIKRESRERLPREKISIAADPPGFSRITFRR